MSWHSVNHFLNQLNATDVYYSYRLPTEAEWEYACRANIGGEYHHGDDSTTLNDFAVYAREKEAGYEVVASKKPNRWGLYDMLGNVAEWVSDWHNDDYYKQSPLFDPKGPKEGDFRLFRGGYFEEGSRRVRCTRRNGHYPQTQIYYLGFRLVAIPR